MDGEVANRLDSVLGRIAAAAEAAGRSAADVTLIAVSKGQPEDRITDALNAGHSVYGENRVQEAQAHWQAARPRHADLELHLIGPLQTNKVRDAVALFDVIQTVDRPKLVDHLLRAFGQIGEARPCFIQVNTGEEPQKAGVLPEQADQFIEHCRTRGVPVVGAMCIPPANEAPAPHFALLGEIARRNGLAGLSMGMSHDFETAVALGATHVRVGTEVFGERAPR